MSPSILLGFVGVEGLVVTCEAASLQIECPLCPTGPRQLLAATLPNMLAFEGATLDSTRTRRSFSHPNREREAPG